MQTLKLILPGSYYDSQIYSGRLYLWNSDGSISTFDWDGLIESVNISEHLKLALICAFQKSEYLYGDHWKLIFQDIEIKTAIENKFKELAEVHIEFSQKDLDRFVIRKQNNPFPFPHSDCTIYSYILYTGSKSGVFSSACNKNNKNPISPKPKKLWDGSTLGISASYKTLGISAGSDGLFQYNLDQDFEWSRYDQPRPLIKQHSNSARWLFASLFSSSYLNEGFLADFDNEYDDEERRNQRILRGVIPSSDIFGHQIRNGSPTLTWGVHDKICFAAQKSVEVVQYSPFSKNEGERFVKLGLVETEPLQGDIVSGDSALFGFIVEGEDGLLVINSLLESSWFPGEPVNWRVFPKSKFYTNQLHIIYDDYLAIHSFNQDYFVDQETKKVGIRLPKIPKWQKRN